MSRPENAIDCDVCEGSGKYPVYGATGKYHFTMPCPLCEGAGHDFGEAAEEAAERAQAIADEQLRLKYEAHMAEQRQANG